MHLSGNIWSVHDMVLPIPNFEFRNLDQSEMSWIVYLCQFDLEHPFWLVQGWKEQTTKSSKFENYGNFCKIYQSNEFYFLVYLVCNSSKFIPRWTIIVCFIDSYAQIDFHRFFAMCPMSENRRWKVWIYVMTSCNNV